MAGRSWDLKGTLFDTFSLTRACSHKFRKCHSELDSCPFDPTLVSAASSVTELRIETRVGRKGPERSSGRHLRVQKWRKKVNFLAKSNGKIGGFRDGGQIVHSRSALAYANRKPCTRELHPPALQLIILLVLIFHGFPKFWEPSPAELTSKLERVSEPAWSEDLEDFDRILMKFPRIWSSAGAEPSSAEPERSSAEPEPG